MACSVHWVAGGARPDEAVATSRLLKRQAGPTVRNHKHVQRPTRTDEGLRFGPVTQYICVLAY